MNESSLSAPTGASLVPLTLAAALIVLSRINRRRRRQTAP